MSILKITHQKRFDIQSAGVFDNVNSYEELNKAIENYGLSFGSKGVESYNIATGAAHEVYCQFFCLKYGDYPPLGIGRIVDTSLDPFNAGYDFTFTAIKDGKPGKLQSKWRSNSAHQFKIGDLSTFCTTLYTSGIEPNNAVLFTNLINDSKKSVFHYSWIEGPRAMRVVDRIAQETIILGESNFWNELREVLKSSCEEEFETPPTNEEHQDEMEVGSNRVIDGEFIRGRVVCATGGGKTLVQYHNVCCTLFKHKGRVTIVVAPTRDLVNQHFSTYYRYRFFHGDAGSRVSAVNFQTGSEPKYNSQEIRFCQTTSGEEVVSIIKSSDRTHINTTYASVGPLLEVLREAGIVPDLLIFDEFQHVVSQQVNDHGISDMRKFLKELSAKCILFYSASQKRGRILSSFDESIYGPLLCNIPYKRLREKGILVPKLRIIPVRIQPTQIDGLSSSIREQAKYFDNVDIREAIIEAAGMIVAYEHAASKNSQCNMITWGKKVSHLKVIGDSEVVRARLAKVGIQKEDFHIIHAEVPVAERALIYEKVRTTDRNIINQHSCASEGINILNLNIGYAARRLGIISMQQGPGGRITRTTKKDRERFKQGELSINSLEGWIKYSATVYVLIEETEDETFLDILRDIIQKLQYAGLTEEDYEFNDIVEERTGDTEINTDWMSEIKTNVGIKQESLEDVIRQARLELEEEEREVLLLEDREKIQAMPISEVFNFAQALMSEEEDNDNNKTQ